MHATRWRRRRRRRQELCLSGRSRWSCTFLALLAWHAGDWEAAAAANSVAEASAPRAAVARAVAPVGWAAVMVAAIGEADALRRCQAAPAPLTHRPIPLPPPRRRQPLAAPARRSTSRAWAGAAMARWSRLCTSRMLCTCVMWAEGGNKLRKAVDMAVNVVAKVAKTAVRVKSFPDKMRGDMLRLTCRARTRVSGFG